MIQIQDLRIQYPSGFRLGPVTMRLAAERTHVFLGYSGSGKTTLLRALLGLEKPSAGDLRLEVGGRPGYVPQEGGLFPHLTNADNVTLPGRIAGMPRRDQSRRLKELRDLVGIEADILERYPREISGGQRQRVSLMRALFTDPPVIFLDEPLGALDPMIRARLQEDLKNIFNRLKKLVIIVTHDLGEAAYFGHTVALFHEGRLLQHSKIEDMVRHPAEPFVTEFLNAQRGFDYREFTE